MTPGLWMAAGAVWVLLALLLGLAIGRMTRARDQQVPTDPKELPRAH